MASLLYYIKPCPQKQKYSKIRHLRAKKDSMRCYSVRCEGGNDLKSEQRNNGEGRKRLRILIAGGGIGGLVLALAAKHKGFEVMAFEKDLSAVRGEGRERGPIQLSSSALAVLKAIDENAAEKIIKAGHITGNKISGFADGISGEWFTKFDLLTPAVMRRIPITQVICRTALQEILVNAVGSEVVRNKSKVVDFIEDPNKVTVILEDGQQYDGDILVGADGIWSTVRSKLFGVQEAKYSSYTCYSGVTNIVAPYIDTVGYQVFLGLNQYFVALYVGNGKMQWYAFHKEPQRNTDPPIGKKKRLLELFGNWCNEVITLIMETPENMILQRDIYDRDMIYCWGIGRVTLLGDAAHPMPPNLGQGGCMAIEDCYQLVLELDELAKSGSDVQQSNEIVSTLRRYEKKRMFRVSAVHAATRMASNMLAAYLPYIEFAPAGPLFHQPTLKIKNPLIEVARALLQFCLPHLVIWMMARHGYEKDLM
ncbi:zeaxanthin epoxidase, chloroplastic-like [Castanea sativa]|uniref:zeaxanthin epoxidase, chloroplastic-like n=1 Tax=Castanea sativa TaxID=21020 RepID=UPI003F64FDBF